MPTKFLHIADIHLGLRTTRFDSTIASKLLEARFQALENARKSASERQTDFVLVCGDLFDDNNIDRGTAERAFRLLDSFPCPVYVLPGNHDPLCAGSVWTRSPWNDLPSGAGIKLLCDRVAIEATADVTLLPCPVTAKTSLSDPFDWITPDSHQKIRLGVGHGSVLDRPMLPLDDHPIPIDTPKRRGLDYVALGHWHGERRFADDHMAYPGTHEQMRFPATDFASGWQAYSSAQLEEFNGDGFGNGLRIEIDAPGAQPRIETVSLGHLRWRIETREIMNPDDFENTFKGLAEAETPERTMLRVSLKGVLPLEKLASLDSMKHMLSRYLWSDVDDSGLSLTPTDADLDVLVSRGISGQVLSRLRGELATNPAPEREELVKHAMLVLYRLSQEAAQ